MKSNTPPPTLAEVKKQILALRKVPQPFVEAERAERARLAMKLVHDSCKLCGSDADSEKRKAVWKEAIQLCRVAVEDAYPTGFWEEYQMLRERSITEPDLLLAFLEDDPWFFRSGYTKEKVIELLVKLTLSEKTQQRLQAVVIQVILKHDRREFSRYCRLARKVSSEALVEQISSMIHAPDQGIARRARWVLDAVTAKNNS